MSLKDRLKLKNAALSKNDIPKSAIDNIEKFKNILSENENILIVCPMGIKPYEVLNFLCLNLNTQQRVVLIGSNLILNQNEVIKFEPDTKNDLKNTIRTSINLKPSKIILEEFKGTEASDIFKLVNSNIKNIITTVEAEDSKKALLQAEFNLYMAGITIPENIMKKMISSFINKIVEIKVVEKNKFYISKICEVSLSKSKEYQIKEAEITIKKITEEKEDTFNVNSEEGILERKIKKTKKPLSKKEIFIAKLKRKK